MASSSVNQVASEAFSRTKTKSRSRLSRTCGEGRRREWRRGRRARATATGAQAAPSKRRVHRQAKGACTRARRAREPGGKALLIVQRIGPLADATAHGPLRRGSGQGGICSKIEGQRVAGQKFFRQSARSGHATTKKPRAHTRQGTEGGVWWGYPVVVRELKGDAVAARSSAWVEALAHHRGLDLSEFHDSDDCKESGDLRRYFHKS